MKVMREHFERALWDTKDLMRNIRDRTKNMERINIRDMDLSYDLEGTRLDLLEAQ